jgi:hypothetical protein
MDFSHLNITGISIAAEQARPPLKIALIGDPGVGKSWAACFYPGQVYNLDFDSRKASLSTHPNAANIMVKTYFDNDPNNPKAMSQFEVDLKALKYAKSQGKEVPSLYVVDSITYARKATESELIKQQSNLGRSVRVGATTVKIPAGWDIINANRLYLEYIISELSSLGDLVCIFHEKDEKDATKSTAEKQAYTGMVTIQPQYLNSILSIFDDVWRIKVNANGKRILQTGISSDFIGKCTLKGLDPLNEEPNLEKLLAKHQAAIASTQGKK